MLIKKLLNSRIFRQIKAVSAVIGVVLMVVIAVAVTVPIYVYVNRVPDSEPGVHVMLDMDYNEATGKLVLSHLGGNIINDAITSGSGGDSGGDGDGEEVTILSNDFESGGLSAWTGSGAASGTFAIRADTLGDPNDNDINPANSGSNFIEMRDLVPAGERKIFTRNAIDISAYSSVKISFQYTYEDTEPDDYLEVYYKDESDAWIEILGIAGNEHGNWAGWLGGSWNNVEVTIPDVSKPDDLILEIRWRTSAPQERFAIDDLTIIGTGAGGGESGWEDASQYDDWGYRKPITINADQVASGDGGSSGWSDTSGNYNDWGYRKKITIQSSDVAGDLTNFPILVSFTDSDLASHAISNGDDIFFTSSDKTTKLDHEIESYSSGTLVAWVEVQDLPSSGTDIYIYYGNSGASNQENIEGVWSNNYALVLHFSETTGNYIDSTSNSNDALSSDIDVTSRSASGKIGKCPEFDGVDGIGNKIIISDDDSLDLPSFTIECWVNPDRFTPDSDWFTLSSKGTTTTDFNWYLPFYQTYFRIINGYSGVKAITSTTFGINEWQYVVAIADVGSSEMRAYKNGVECTYSQQNWGGSSKTNSNDLWIGGNIPWSGEYFDGYIDEFRISNNVKSDAWIETSYNSMNNPGFLSRSSQEQRPAGGGSGEDSHSNFPVLISVTDSDLASHAISNGDDIFFTSSDKTTKLDHEIESYSSGALVAWVRIPTLSSSDDTLIYMYYGNSGASNQENVNGVWNNYAMVYHFNEPTGTTGANSISDSTGSTSGTPSSGLTFAQSGKIANSIDFFSSTGINCGTLGPGTLTAETTISFWIYANSYASPSRQNPLDHSYGGWGTMTIETNGGISWFYGSNGGDAQTYTNHQSNLVMANSEWIYISAVRDPSTYTYSWYKNGILENSNSYSSSYPNIQNQVFTIGDGYVNPINGKLDEFRVSTDALSLEWIQTCYNTMNNPSGFCTLGSQEVRPIVGGGGSGETSFNNLVVTVIGCSPNITSITGSEDFFQGYTITIEYSGMPDDLSGVTFSVMYEPANQLIKTLKL